MSASNSSLSKTIRCKQERLIKEAERYLHGEALPQELVDAFFATPRHAFAQSFYSHEDAAWIELSEATLKSRLDFLYKDAPICIARDIYGRTTSTISQPSLVLYMLHLLDLKPGQKVYELGGGSGWNAALMGRLVGEQGQVHSVEIDKNLVDGAVAATESLNIGNVSFYRADGCQGLEAHAPFDRGVFTASSFELPSVFFEQIKEGGLLLFVLKQRDGSDLLLLMRKEQESFVALLSLPCSFVPVTGPTSKEAAPVMLLEEIACCRNGPSRQESWNALSIDESCLKAFTAFCRNIEAEFRDFETSDNRFLETEILCGILSEDASSLAIATDKGLQQYGGEEAWHGLMRLWGKWASAGKPDTKKLGLRIYPGKANPVAGPNAWIDVRSECVLSWSLP